MKYDWENQITPEILYKIEELLPLGFSLLGVAVAECKNGGGALIANVEPDNDLWLADVMHDIMFDAKAHYEAVRAKTFGAPVIP